MLLVLLLLMGLVPSSGVGVVVNSRVPSQLIRTGKLLAASWELAGMRLLSCVSANVPGLVLEAVECLVAERALVGAREFIGCLRGRGTG